MQHRCVLVTYKCVDIKRQTLMERSGMKNSYGVTRCIGAQILEDLPETDVLDSAAWQEGTHNKIVCICIAAPNISRIPLQERCVTTESILTTLGALIGNICGLFLRDFRGRTQVYLRMIAKLSGGRLLMFHLE